MLGAIILGAGRGERLGGPKALLLLEGRTMAERHVERALDVGCDPVVLVVRPEVAQKVDARACPHVRLALSEAPDPAGSLAVGLRTLGECERVLITPVDTLPASKEICARLRAALDLGAMAATPAHRGRGGHPVLCRAEVLADYRAGGADRIDSVPGAEGFPPLRTVLSALGPARVRVEVDEPTIPIDLDTPQDLRQLAGISAPVFAERVVLSPGTPLRLK
ncbi:NTP transferase domain-containing protein [Pendulispora albinea]|uniref:NTP transferase domain-containing protein n=1 Tax=Pendulispora albinea TaxID=2741071 RepID=A0ABZ2LRY0_9BACT